MRVDDDFVNEGTVENNGTFSISGTLTGEIIQNEGSTMGFFGGAEIPSGNYENLLIEGDASLGNYIMIGGAILIGRLGASDFRLGFIMVMFTFIHFYQILHFDRKFNMRLTERLHNEFMDPVYGLGSIILNYDNLYNFNF